LALGCPAVALSHYLSLSQKSNNISPRALWGLSATRPEPGILFLFGGFLAIALIIVMGYNFKKSCLNSLEAKNSSPAAFGL
jgi:hypothetical protein